MSCWVVDISFFSIPDRMVRKFRSPAYTLAFLRNISKKIKILGVYLYIIEYHRYIDDHRCVLLGDVSGMPKQCDSETFGACQGAACKMPLRFSITTAPWLTSDIQ